PASAGHQGRHNARRRDGQGSWSSFLPGGSHFAWCRRIEGAAFWERHFQPFPSCICLQRRLTHRPFPPSSQDHGEEGVVPRECVETVESFPIWRFHCWQLRREESPASVSCCSNPG